MNSNTSKIVVIIAFVLGIVLLASAVPSCSKSGHRVSKKIETHQYDYILEVSDSNNRIFYNIYDEKHHRVGGVLANRLDSLIIADNQ